MLFAPFLLRIVSGSFIVSLLRSIGKKYIDVLEIRESKLNNFKISKDAFYLHHKSSQLPLNDEIDSARLEEIHNSIDGIYVNDRDPHKILPMDISKIIHGYEDVDPLKYVYDKVMIGFNISKEERADLDFYKEDFLDKIHSIISSKEKNNLSNVDYRHLLGKLIFKWMIYMNQKFFDNDEKLELISKSIKSNLVTRGDKDLTFPSYFGIRSEKHFSIHKFVELIKSEMFESPHVFHSFASVLEYFYDKKGKNKVTCNDLKMKCFDGKDFDINIILKWLIIMYDPIGIMRIYLAFNNKDWKDDQISMKPSFKIFFFPEKMFEKYLRDLRSRGPEDHQISGTRYITKSMMEFFLETDRRFLISNCYSLVTLLSNLKENELLTKESVIKIVGFKINNQRLLEWNQEKYKSFLKECRPSFETGNVESRECDEYLKLLN